MKYTAFLLLPLLVSAAPAPAAVDGPTQSNTATVDLTLNRGTPQKLASGIIYGVPNNPAQIPDKFYTEPGLKWFRASGAQLQAPSRGWAFGEYGGRFNFLKTQYQNSRKFGANHIALLNDLWGLDGQQNQKTTPCPGDNGDWRSWDAFLSKLMFDIKKSSITSGLYIDIWNEPEGLGFWEGRSQQQWLDLYGRTYHALRAGLPTVKLIGPTTATAPYLDNTWWTNFLDFVKTNGSQPDQYVWHVESGQAGSNAFLDQVSNLNTMLSQRNLPQKPINIDEYATFNEQNPASSAWWIAQLERYNAIGLRGNWLSFNSLHDYLASLISKPNGGDFESDTTLASTGYFGNGEYQVYKYYNQQMTGNRVASTSSTDGRLDAFSVIALDHKVKTLVGVSGATGTWYLTIKGLSKVGLPTRGNIDIQTYGFPFTGGHFGRVDAPKDLGIVRHAYSGDFVQFPIFQTDEETAYTFEFNIPSS